MAQSSPQFAFFQGGIVPIAEAQISIMTHALNYGTAVFEGIRAYWNAQQQQLYAFQLREHYVRFLNSCRTLMIDLPYDVHDLCNITLDLLRREEYQSDTYLRPLGYKASKGIGVRLHGLENAFSLFAVPYGKYVDSEGPIKVGVSSWRRVDDNSIPARAKIAGAYVNSAFAKSEAQLNGFDEAIVLNHDGHVSEGSAENFWMIRNGKAVTPCVTDNILEGITRKVVMELLQNELGVEVVERTIDRTELYQAEEMFLCGTGAEITLVGEVDHRKVGTGDGGPISTRLRDLYFAAVRGNLPRYKQWCTPVYPANGNSDGTDGTLRATAD